MVTREVLSIEGLLIKPSCVCPCHRPDFCAGRTMESGLEAAAVGVRTVGDSAKDIDLSASLAIGDEETCGPFSL